MANDLNPSTDGMPTGGGVRPLALRAMFWRPDWLVDSAWLEHLPFLMWLIEAQRPRVVVELGTDDGASYFAMCQAVDRLALDTRCFAVRDPRRRDGQWARLAEQAEVFHQDRYAAFSRILHLDPEQSVTHFTRGSVDLLVVDAAALGERTRHVIETWRSCLSADAVLVVHGTAAPGADAGLWPSGLAGAAPGLPRFEFFHGEGLSCGGAGAHVSPMVQELLRSQNDETARKSLHEVFARLGRACADNRMAVAQRERALRLQAERDEAVSELERLRSSGAAVAGEPASEFAVREAVQRAERAEAALARLGSIDPAEIARLRKAEANSIERESLVLRLRAEADKKAEAELKAARDDARTSKSEAKALADALAAAKSDIAEIEAKWAGKLEDAARKAEAELKAARESAGSDASELKAAGDEREAQWAARLSDVESKAQAALTSAQAQAAQAEQAWSARLAQAEAGHARSIAELEQRSAAALAHAVAEHQRATTALETAHAAAKTAALARIAELEAALAETSSAQQSSAENLVRAQQVQEEGRQRLEAALAETAAAQEALAQARKELSDARTQLQQLATRSREAFSRLEGQLASQRETLAARDARVTSLEAELQQLRSRIAADEASRIERQRQVESELAAAQVRIGALQDAERAASRDRESAAQEQAALVRQRDQLLAERDALAREQRSLASSLQARFDELSRMARLNTELEARMEAALADAGARAARTSAEAEARLREAANARRNLEIALAEERTRREALEASRAWRFTAPARRTGQWVRKVFKPRVGDQPLDEIGLLRQSSLFDAGWYLQQLPDGIAPYGSPEEHYLREGVARGLDPSPWFSTRGYLEANRDVEAAGINPLLHYVAHGRVEGRPTQ